MKLFDWFKNLFNDAISKFKELFAAAFPVAKQIVVGALTEIAMNAVTRLDATTLSNEEKRKEAFNQIKTYATQKGIEAKDHLISLALEMAVSALRGTQTP